MKQRHPEPMAVTLYKAGPPRCCHTCEHYGNDGLCVTFFMEPPEDFATTVDSCPEWEIEIPF